MHGAPHCCLRRLTDCSYKLDSTVVRVKKSGIFSPLIMQFIVALHVPLRLAFARSVQRRSIRHRGQLQLSERPTSFCASKPFKLGMRAIHICMDFTEFVTTIINFLFDITQPQSANSASSCPSTQLIPFLMSICGPILLSRIYHTIPSISF